MKRSTISTLCKVALGVAIVLWLLAAVDPGAVAETMGRLHRGRLALACTAYLAGTLVQALRLWTLTAPWRPGVHWATAVTFGSYFLNQLLPSGMGGEAYRALRLQELCGSWTKGIGLVTLERFVGAISLLLPATIHAVLRGPNLAGRLPRTVRSHGDLPELVWIILPIVLIAVVVAWIVPRIPRLRPAVARTWMELKTTFSELSRRRYMVLVIFSFAYHALRVTGLWLLLAALRETIVPFDGLLVLALLLLTSLLPLSLGALGVHEGVIVFSLQVFGVTLSASLAAALLHRAILLVFALAGGATLVTKQDRLEPPRKLAPLGDRSAPTDPAGPSSLGG